jgi:NO-binding membrane sensor protein with MHYT domain
MHYLGMPAFSLPIPVLCDWPTVLLSLLADECGGGDETFSVSQSG